MEKEKDREEEEEEEREKEKREEEEREDEEKEEEEKTEEEKIKEKIKEKFWVDIVEPEEGPQYPSLLVAQRLSHSIERNHLAQKAIWKYLRKNSWLLKEALFMPG